MFQNSLNFEKEINIRELNTKKNTIIREKIDQACFPYRGAENWGSVERQSTSTVSKLNFKK